MGVSAGMTRSVMGRTNPTSSRPDGAVWRAHPLVARVLRSTTVLLPVGAAAGVVFLLERVLPSPGSWVMYAAIAAVDVVAALTTVLVVHSLAMRMLPLATLLSLSLVFPDQAPRRFAIALRANSTAKLRSRVATSHDEDSDIEAAIGDVLTYLAALSRHDRMTRGHCERVRAFVDLLAVQMDLSTADQDRLRWSALLHDIGKLQVPGPILRKPEKPTDKEWETLKRHPVDGAEIIRPLAPWLGAWALAVEQHHERFGGHGYPLGLAGTDISLGGRILAVADAYEVMITSRPYKRPVRPEAARRELVRYADEQFDPDIVRAFLGIAIGDLRKVMGLLGFLSEVPLLATVPRAEALIEMAGRQTIGVVGTAAGTGALVAAATLSPVHLPAASVHSPRIEVNPITARPTFDGSPGSQEVSPTVASRSLTVKGSDGTPSAEREPVTNPRPTTTPVSPGSADASSSAGSSAPPIAVTANSVDLPADDSNSGTDGIDNSSAAAVGSTTEDSASTAFSAAKKVTSTAGSAASTAVSAVKTDTSTPGSTAEGAASTADSAVDRVADGFGEHK